MYSTITIHKDNSMCGARALISTFTAHNGTEWGNIFLSHNSDTYNNDFITNMKKFKKNIKPTKNLVNAVEQLPSDSKHIIDATTNLTTDGFVASSNASLTEEVYYFAEYFYPYMKHPRYLISKHDLPKITTFEAFKNFT